MNGTTFYLMSQQIKDTISVHGFVWTLEYFIGRGVSEWEFMILSKGVQA